MPITLQKIKAFAVERAKLSVRNAKVSASDRRTVGCRCKIGETCSICLSFATYSWDEEDRQRPDSEYRKFAKECIDAVSLTPEQVENAFEEYFNEYVKKAIRLKIRK